MTKEKVRKRVEERMRTHLELVLTELAGAFIGILTKDEPIYFLETIS